MCKKKTFIMSVTIGELYLGRLDVSNVPKLGTSDISVYCTYKLKWKPLFDGKARLDLIVSL